MTAITLKEFYLAYTEFKEENSEQNIPIEVIMEECGKRDQS